MKKLIILIVILFNAFISTLCVAKEKIESPRFSLGLNLSETLGFVAVSKLIGTEAVYVPIHLDGAYRFTEKWSLAFGIVYRYEDYNVPIKNPFGQGSSVELWTNYHELFLMAGPRYSFFGKREGLYTALKVGPGAAISSGGYAISAVAQPEIGYNILFGEKTAFELDFALGCLFNIPLIERPHLGYDLTAIGWLAHRTIPIFRIGVGIAF